jgi:GntR family transcriptional regulator
MSDPRKKRRRGRPLASADVSISGSRRLDRNSPVPLYYQLAAALKDKLDSGNWQPESRFPTEREIAEEFGVSRTVIRPALNLLVGDGAIIRRRGSGAFVTAPRLEFPTVGLTKALADPPKDLDLTILAAYEGSPEPAVARYLKIERSGTTIVHVSALMHFEGRPICFMESYSSSALAPGLLESIAAAEREADPPYPADLELTRSTASIELTFFGPWAGPQLEASPGDPALIARLVQYAKMDHDEEERPLEFAYQVFRTDITQLMVENN